MAELRIAHLYPDLLHTYGDRGNVSVLVRRSRARGIETRVLQVTRGERLPRRCDLIFIGGGSDRIQAAIGPDLLARRDRLAGMVADGAVVLGVCGGYQLLGSSYSSAVGRMEGLGLLDAHTVAGEGRIVGRVRVTRPSLSPGLPLLGFENHAGRTWIESHVMPLGRVARGRGNNGADRTEGAVQGRVFGTYLHGPVLALNPSLADHLLSLVVGRDLPALPDEAETAARRDWQGVWWKRLAFSAPRRG